MTYSLAKITQPLKPIPLVEIMVTLNTIRELGIELLLDVGSGHGLFGTLIALNLPSITVVGVESNAQLLDRKVQFCMADHPKVGKFKDQSIVGTVTEIAYHSNAYDKLAGSKNTKDHTRAAENLIDDAMRQFPSKKFGILLAYPAATTEFVEALVTKAMAKDRFLGVIQTGDAPIGGDDLVTTWDPMTLGLSFPRDGKENVPSTVYVMTKDLEDSKDLELCRC
jgi:hypothetical protein